MLSVSVSISAESTDRKRTAMKRFKERLARLTTEEADIVNRCHRRYVKTIPGKLDHASMVAVNLGRMNSYFLRSADPRYSEFTFSAVRTESSRSLGSLGGSSISADLDLEHRRGSLK